ncbi:MAG: hypothetical protein RQ751_01215, partial [Longimicrobiales bacterium]|nr:hypothetical protein [Longimicrobiales bacterium]
MDAPERDFRALVAQTGGLQPWRRVFHACSGVMLGLAPGLLALPRATTLALLGGALAVAMALDLARLSQP